MITMCDNYLSLYKNKWNKCYTEALENGSNDPDYDASIIFDEGCSPEEVVGYYLYYYEEEALRQWRGNIEGLELNKNDRKIDEILASLQVHCTDCTYKFCRNR